MVKLRITHQTNSMLLKKFLYIIIFLSICISNLDANDAYFKQHIERVKNEQLFSEYVVDIDLFLKARKTIEEHFTLNEVSKKYKDILQIRIGKVPKHIRDKLGSKAAYSITIFPRYRQFKDIARRGYSAEVEAPISYIIDESGNILERIINI